MTPRSGIGVALKGFDGLECQIIDGLFENVEKIGREE
jgi:hypothetical protein